jgi:hypothetical protein
MQHSACCWPIKHLYFEYGIQRLTAVANSSSMHAGVKLKYGVNKSLRIENEYTTSKYLSIGPIVTVIGRFADVR